MKKAIYENRAMPSAIISPDEVIGEEERDRLEAQWNTKFRRGGAGRVVVGESKLNVSVLQQSMGDLAQLAEIRATMEDICNAFHVPIAYMTTNVNASLWRGLLTTPGSRHAAHEERDPPAPAAPRREAQRAAAAAVQPMASATLQFPYLDITTVQLAGNSPFFGGVIASWTAEAQTRQETEPRFKMMELKAQELSGYTVSSKVLLQDAAFGLEKFLFTLCGLAVTWYE